MTLQVHILARTPGAEGVEWAQIAHSREDFILVHHQRTRETSRWITVERKRPFIVSYVRRRPRSCGWSERSAHETLAAAVASAHRIANE